MKQPILIRIIQPVLDVSYDPDYDCVHHETADYDYNLNCCLFRIRQLRLQITVTVERQNKNTIIYDHSHF